MTIKAYAKSWRTCSSPAASMSPPSRRRRSTSQAVRNVSLRVCLSMSISPVSMASNCSVSSLMASIQPSSSLPFVETFRPQYARCGTEQSTSRRSPAEVLQRGAASRCDQLRPAATPRSICKVPRLFQSYRWQAGHGTERGAASVVIAVVHDDRAVLESLPDLLACADISETPGTAICVGALMARCAGSTRLNRWPGRSRTGRVP
jgi:hypothetical protein